MTGAAPATALPLRRAPIGARALFGLAILAIALNLRPVFSSLAAVLPEVMRDTGASSLAAGLATTLPVVCLGLFSPFATRVAARLGTERTLLGVTAVVAAGSALRAFATVPALLAAGVVAGAAIAFGNVLLPTLIKRDFADRSALMTGLYSMAMCGGAALGAGLTVPVEHRFGGWPAALGSWAVPAGIAFLLWLPFCLRPGRGAARPNGPRGANPLWRDRLAWKVTVFMGLQSALAYSVFGWMAPILRSRGISAEEAGLITSASIMAQVVSSLATPFLATRGRDQRATCLALLALAVIGLVGALFAPHALVPISVAIQGIGQGGLFAVAMVLIILRSPNPDMAGHLSGMSQTVGYLLAALGPLLIGIVRDLTGSYGATAILFAALGAGAAWAALEAGRNRLVGPSEAAAMRPAR